MNVITLPTVSMDLQDRRPGPTPLMALHDARVRTACRECTSLAKPVPAQSMGVETGAIRAGQRANLTLFSAYVFSPGIWWIGLTMNLPGSEVQILQMYS